MGILDKHLNELDKFVCLLSALGHDIGKKIVIFIIFLDHTGRRNEFEIAKKSKLSLRYNDEAVFFFKIIKLYLFI